MSSHQIQCSLFLVLSGTFFFRCFYFALYWHDYVNWMMALYVYIEYACIIETIVLSD